MANVTRDRLSASLFIGDVKGIVDASDIAATPANVLGRPCIKFPDGSDESAAVTHVLPVPSNYAGGNIIARIAYCGDSAPGANNGVNFEGAFEAISESDAHDLGPGGTADAFAAVQEVADTIDANAGELNFADITFTQAQADGLMAGQAFRFVLRRDSDDGTNDTYADSVWVFYVELLEVE